MGRLLSQSKVKVYNVTLDGVIIVCTSSIFLMLLTLQNNIYSSIPRPSLAVCTLHYTL